MSLPDSVYKERMADYQQRLDKMMEYISSTDQCRSRMLLRYFGEKATHDCGQCDVCLEKKRTVSAQVEEVQQTMLMVKDFLSDGAEHQLAELNALSAPTEAIQEAVRYMMMEDLLHVDGFRVKWKGDGDDRK